MAIATRNLTDIYRLDGALLVANVQLIEDENTSRIPIRLWKGNSVGPSVLATVSAGSVTSIWRG